MAEEYGIAMKRADLNTFLETLRANKVYVFSKLDLTRLFGWSATSVTFLLHRYARKGVILRLKRGLYSLSGVAVSEFYIANILYEPSYVSLEAALAFHHVIPEVVYTITSVTTKATRTHRVKQLTYAYHKIKRQAYTGYEPIDQGGFTVLMATPEKAFVDYCYLVTKGVKAPLDPDRLRRDRLNEHLVRKYTELFKSYWLKKIIAEYLDKSAI
jgi:predicted transcriptional regulator of viral defense system